MPRRSPTASMSSIVGRSSFTARRNRRSPMRRSCAHCAGDGCVDVKRICVLACVAAALLAGAAEAGHELAVYPSYYPHEIAIRVMPSERAAAALRDSKIQAYVGALPEFDDPPP